MPVNVWCVEPAGREGCPMRRPVVTPVAGAAVVAAVTQWCGRAGRDEQVSHVRVDAVQRHVHRAAPVHLPASARFSVANGAYSTWIVKGDKEYSPGPEPARVP